MSATKGMSATGQLTIGGIPSPKGVSNVDERMFDGDSFTDEIENEADAESCVDYFSRNERNFRKSLMDEGLTHEQEEAAVKEVCANLIKSCRRVGYRDEWVDAKEKRYKL